MESVKQIVKQRIARYDSEAYIYIEKRPWMRTYVVSRLLNFLNTYVDNAVAVLDIGCGPGWLEKCLFPNMSSGTIFVSLDISRKMAEATHKFVPQVNVIVADGENLPFRTESFDLIITSRCIKFMNLSRMIKEAKRVLRSGGIVIVVFDCGDAFWVKLLERLGILVDVGGKNRTLRTEELRSKLNIGGLSFVKASGITAFPLSIFGYIPKFLIKLIGILDVPTALGPRINIVVAKN
jgi:SAM-dependent methyltransferase